MLEHGAYIRAYTYLQHIIENHALTVLSLNHKIGAYHAEFNLIYTPLEVWFCKRPNTVPATVQRLCKIALFCRVWEIESQFQAELALVCHRRVRVGA